MFRHNPATRTHFKSLMLLELRLYSDTVRSDILIKPRSKGYFAYCDIKSCPFYLTLYNFTDNILFLKFTKPLYFESKYLQNRFNVGNKYIWSYDKIRFHVVCYYCYNRIDV